jgi:hypothetical protein
MGHASNASSFVWEGAGSSMMATPLFPGSRRKTLPLSLPQVMETTQGITHCNESGIVRYFQRIKSDLNLLAKSNYLYLKFNERMKYRACVHRHLVELRPPCLYHHIKREFVFLIGEKTPR